WLDGLRFGERHQPTLRATADGSGGVQLSAECGAPGKDEARERRKIRFETIDPLLEGRDLGVPEALERRQHRRRGGRELGTQVEELRLDRAERIREPSI